MCGSKGGDSGKDARRAEAERQAAIQAGTAQVNKAFGTFTDDYFGGLQDDYTSYYTPQLEEQFNKARKNLILNNPGGSATSSFAQRMSELEKQYREQQGVISGQAVDAATQRRAEIEQNRSNLLSQVNAGLGADSAARLAINQSKAFTKPLPFSPLADVFAQATADVANAKLASRQGYESAAPLLFNAKPKSALNVQV
jgi:hypothetical protein